MPTLNVNVRASGPKDESIRLTPPRRMSLEQAIAYVQDDEQPHADCGASLSGEQACAPQSPSMPERLLVEVTPKVVRLRKRFLDPHERKRASRRSEAA